MKSSFSLCWYGTKHKSPFMFCFYTQTTHVCSHLKHLKRCTSYNTVKLCLCNERGEETAVLDWNQILENILILCYFSVHHYKHFIWQLWSRILASTCEVTYSALKKYLPLPDVFAYAFFLFVYLLQYDKYFLYYDKYYPVKFWNNWLFSIYWKNS